MKRCLAVLAGIALLVSPTVVRALDVAYDDGTFEAIGWRNPSEAAAVRFDLTSGVPHDLTGASFWFSALDPGQYTVSVHVWDRDLADVFSTPFTVDYTVEGWYALDLSAAGLVLEDSFRLGFFQDDPVIDLHLGLDDTAPTGNSAIYLVGPDTWLDNPNSNHGIRVSVEPAPVVPALTCRGFGPPLHKPRTLRKGGRTLPLKATLADESGVAVGGADLTESPVVQVLFYPDSGGGPVDVSEFVLPAGRSNTGASFRFTDEGRWRYNLKTRRFVSAGRYEISLMSGDAAEYLVDPTCTAEVTIKEKEKKNKRQRKVR